MGLLWGPNSLAKYTEQIQGHGEASMPVLEDGSEDLHAAKGITTD